MSTSTSDSLLPPHLPLDLSKWLCFSLLLFPYLSLSHSVSKPGGRLGCSHKASTVSPAASLPVSPSTTVGVAERESERRSHLSPACPPPPHPPPPCLSGTKAVPLNSAQWCWSKRLLCSVPPLQHHHPPPASPPVAGLFQQHAWKESLMAAC